MTCSPTITHDAQVEANRLALRKKLRQSLQLVALCCLFIVAFPATVWAAESGTETSSFLQVALFLGGLSLLPFAVMTLTSFLRIVVVLSFLRSGLGAQNVPPNMVIIALSLFLSLFVMGPTIDNINAKALQPLQAKKPGFTQEKAFNIAGNELKTFMVNQIGRNSREEVKTFYTLAKKQTPVCTGAKTPKADKCLANEKQLTCSKDPCAADEGINVLPMRIVIPAFIVSELKKAFIMGFAVLLPFLVIDMVISNILLSLGMFMLPPVVISLPFKILLFVLSGGWTMVIKFLVEGFNY